MTEDRTAHDPFAPAPRSTGGGHLAAATPHAEPDSGPSEPSGVSGASIRVPMDEQPDNDGLSLLRRVELVQIAEREGVSAYGNRDALLARIRSHRADRKS